jgi:hypothetical protein
LRGVYWIEGINGEETLFGKLLEKPLAGDKKSLNWNCTRNLD